MRRQRSGYGVVLCASLVLVGCSVSRQGPPGQYAQARDSATQASVSRPQLAMPQAGEKMPVVPPLRPVRPPVAGALAAGAAAGGQAVIDASKSLEAELRGTLEPDVVIHGGAPHQVQAVYDFKFPCLNTDRKSPWRDYPEGRAHAGSNQRELYEKALKVSPARVQPHLGVY